MFARVVSIQLGEHPARSLHVVEQCGGAGAVVLDNMRAAGRGVEPLAPELGQGSREMAGHELRRRDPRDAAGEIVAGGRLPREQLFGRHSQILLQR